MLQTGIVEAPVADVHATVLVLVHPMYALADQAQQPAQ